MYSHHTNHTLCMFPTYTRIPITKLCLKFLMNGGIIIIITINFMCLNVFLHVCLCTTCAPSTTKSRRGCQIPWKWNCRLLLAPLQVLETAPETTGRITWLFIRVVTPAVIENVHINFPPDHQSHSDILSNKLMRLLARGSEIVHILCLCNVYKISLF